MKDHFKAHGIVHLCWTIGVLIALLISILSGKFAANNSIKDILSFAVSLTSLVLAMIAIIQALLSTSSLTETFGIIYRTIEKLERPSAEISEAAKTLNLRSQTIDQHATKISDRLDTLLSQGEENKETRTTNKETRATTSVGTAEKTLIEHLPVGGTTALYVVAKAVEAKREFTPLRIFRDNRMSFFVTGFLQALDSLRLMTIDRSGEGKLRVRDLGRMTWISSEIENMPKHFGKESAKAFQKLQAEIDSYFSEDSTEAEL